jgi:hypothetical protein
LPEPELNDEDDFIDAESYVENETADVDIEHEDASLANESKYNLRDRATHRRPQKLDDYIGLIDTHTNPTTYDEALRSPSRNK